MLVACRCDACLCVQHGANFGSPAPNAAWLGVSPPTRTTGAANPLVQDCNWRSDAYRCAQGSTMLAACLPPLPVLALAPCRTNRSTAPRGRPACQLLLHVQRAGNEQQQQHPSLLLSGSWVQCAGTRGSHSPVAAGIFDDAAGSSPHDFDFDSGDAGARTATCRRCARSTRAGGSPSCAAPARRGTAGCSWTRRIMACSPRRTTRSGPRALCPPPAGAPVRPPRGGTCAWGPHCRARWASLCSRRGAACAAAAEALAPSFAGGDTPGRRGRCIRWMAGTGGPLF